MRPVIAYTCALIALAGFTGTPLHAGDAPSPTTLILHFEQRHSERTLNEVRGELGHVMQNAGFTFDLKLFSELGPWAEFNNLMLVRMKGNCRLDAGPVPQSERGPLALAHTSDGKVLPFIDVSCDRVRALIRPVLSGDQFRNSEALMGRALARVIAHEIYHVLTGAKHSESGIARHALSGAQLVSDQLLFQPEDVERMVASSSF